ncbi:MAG TPA: hypothetical protein VI485_15140 [Vicinamibacterales bacterium]|nr:hypothetical protein [Vicinamibacterales bacterium]
MAGVPLPAMSPWNRQALRIPPDSFRAWLRLALWELWMGMIVCGFLGFGALLIVTSPRHIFTSEDLTDCYASSPVVQPCERIVHRGGELNVAFTVLCGVLLIVVAAWLLWELWIAVEPKPITDDFLKLLHDSFGHDWRDPRTWPWTRLLWAYGFTLVGATVTAGAGLMIWTLVASSSSAKAPTIHIDTSQSFRLDQ